MHGSSTKMLFQPLKQCKVGSILSSEKFVILKNWCTLPNLAKLSATKNQQKILPILPKRERFFTRNLERLWRMDRQFIYAKSCCGQNLYKGIAEYLQIKRWSWCDPAWPFFNVSRYYVNRIGWSNIFRLLS